MLMNRCSVADGGGEDNGGEPDDKTLIDTMKKLQVRCDV
jgi:hypothetical protein